MVYYSDGEKLKIGFVFNKKERKELTVKNLLDYLSKIENIEYLINEGDLPANFNLRIYVYDPYDDDAVMVLKSIIMFLQIKQVFFIIENILSCLKIFQKYQMKVTFIRQKM
ncbi:hypothetical protein EII29_10565 [Leptotrichia sp. OH3620_COT-345]|uniref:hypothetical protein n=1 Tax=Leptotrichia sp. OH3620_COT-345 TaxID=2491048 RepID=UPI000F64BE4D|nr:hypothetical protein [Leptotrichia sp. OH3620_COT-345]RRD38265.1 hypothetical protein EII29_10565 [Leptotrichia sp. OH3620_COT-345]